MALGSAAALKEAAADRAARANSGVWDLVDLRVQWLRCRHVVELLRIGEGDRVREGWVFIGSKYYKAAEGNPGGRENSEED